jgi:hypothetical protein
MSSISTVAGTLAALFLLAGAAGADQKFKSTLAGHALLPATTAVQPPADAPAYFGISGRYNAPGGVRVDEIGKVPGTSFLGDAKAPRATGHGLPMRGQPIQGFSGIKAMKDGTFWTMQDNGFGSKGNSPDALLMLHHLAVDWKAGGIAIKQTLFLHDPDRKIPFRIVNEASDKRYLTGADLDVEAFQPIGNAIWIGDEFGPYLIRVDLTGKVTGFWETTSQGKPVRSPDHHAVGTPAVPGGAVAFNARRSRGYEGMAASLDGKFLYALLEGPLWDETAKAWEADGGKEYLRVLEFDVAAEKWTGRYWKYKLEVNGNNIGDFNMIDATTALVVERDNGEGDAAKACPPGQPRPDCFNVPAKFKRVYKIEMSAANANGFARKIGHVDLMDIDDPNKVARRGGASGKFSFPFVTIENVDIVDAEHIVVGNDNNFPFSSGREIGKNDDNELILLRVPEFLKAK